MDGNTTITISLFLGVAGFLYGWQGFLAKRDSKKLQEGENQGVLKATLKTMDETLKSISLANSQFQKDHREEHQKLDERMKKVEKFVIEHNVERKKNNTIVEE